MHHRRGRGRAQRWVLVIHHGKHRIAIVGDAGRLRHAVDGLGWLMPGATKVLGPPHLHGAREWVASMLADQERIH